MEANIEIEVGAHQHRGRAGRHVDLQHQHHLRDNGQLRIPQIERCGWCRSGSCSDLMGPIPIHLYDS